MTADESKTLQQHDEILLGRNGEPGIAHQVKFMWRIHVWILCSISGITGYCFCWVVEKMSKHF